MASADDNSSYLRLTAAITKRLDASWTVGTGNGGLDTGTKTAGVLYHVWLIKRSDTGVVDALFSTSATAPTMPSGYDKKRWLGWIITDSSTNNIFQADWLGNGADIEMWFRERQTILSGFTNSAYTATSLSSVIPSSLSRCLGLFSFGISVEGWGNIYASSDGTNALTYYSGYNSGPPASTLSGYSDHYSFIPIINNQVYFKMNSGTGYAYLRAISFAR